MRRLARGRVLAGLGLLIALTLVFVARWLNANKIGGQGPAEPFRIAGNFYYVGATDVSAFLITGPEGHVVLDAGYPTTAKLIMGSIAKLGFDIKDVKVLLNSEPHPDHARTSTGGTLPRIRRRSSSGSDARVYRARRTCSTAVRVRVPMLLRVPHRDDP
jgi:hypothetical protein